jgi:hypothetical protein
MDLCRKQTKNTDYLKKLANADIKLLKDSFGKNIDSVKDLIEQVNIIIAIEHIDMPLTRDSFQKICASLFRQNTQRQAIECVLTCRGAEGERSKDFSFEKFIEYLYNQLPYMPPIGKPRALIESFSPKHPLPSP